MDPTKLFNFLTDKENQQPKPNWNTAATGGMKLNKESPSNYNWFKDQLKDFTGSVAQLKEENEHLH